MIKKPETIFLLVRPKQQQEQQLQQYSFTRRTMDFTFLWTQTTNCSFKKNSFESKGLEARIKIGRHFVFSTRRRYTRVL